MTVILYDTAGQRIGPATIAEPQKRPPSFVFLAPLPGGYRFFMRHLPAHESDANRYDEVKPVEVELIQEG